MSSEPRRAKIRAGMLPLWSMRRTQMCLLSLLTEGDRSFPLPVRGHSTEYNQALHGRPCHLTPAKAEGSWHQDPNLLMTKTKAHGRSDKDRLFRRTHDSALSGQSRLGGLFVQLSYSCARCVKGTVQPWCIAEVRGTTCRSHLSPSPRDGAQVVGRTVVPFLNWPQRSKSSLLRLSGGSQQNA